MKKNRIIAWFLMMLLLLVTLTGCGAGTKETKTIDLAATAQWLQDTVPEPAPGSVGGEWLVLGLARSGTEALDGYMEGYYGRLEAMVQAQDGVLDKRKYTEYSRVILALTSIGKDPSDVAGYNLLVPLADYEQTIFQGINGPIFALLALDSGSYEIPAVEGEGQQAAREMYVDYILSQEAPEGGWSFGGGAADVDITAMALQALAKYQTRQDVADAVERGLAVLSDLQKDDGSYEAYGSRSSESVSQVIVALGELGIDTEDSRFVKKGNSLADSLLAFRTEDGAFRHTMDGDADLMATEQAFYALASMKRMEQGMSSLYDMKADR